MKSAVARGWNLNICAPGDVSIVNDSGCRRQDRNPPEEVVRTVVQPRTTLLQGGYLRAGVGSDAGHRQRTVHNSGRRAKNLVRRPELCIVVCLHLNEKRRAMRCTFFRFSAEAYVYASARGCTLMKRRPSLPCVNTTVPSTRA